MPTLEFAVSGQHIERVDDVQPVAKSREYIDAHFEFLSPEWEGIKTAIFSSGNGAIRRPLDDNGNCVVPWEFWDADRDLTGYVSVFCGDLVTADRAPVRMYQSGYQETDESREPTPDEYQQMVERVEAITKECNELLTKLGKKVDSNYETLDAKKANIADPVFTGSMSMGRKENSAVGIGSVALGLDIQAVGDYTIGVGVSTYAGCKAYYMKSIDMTAKIIYLCKEKNTFPEMNTQDNTDASFDTPSYEIGDEFSIINGNHYVLCAKITSISNNAIGYDVDLPFHSFDQDDFSELDGHTFFVPSKPNIGAVVITNSSFASGVNNIAAGTGSEVAGKNNIAASSYGHVEGRNNIAGYTSHAEGMFNDARGESSHVEGNTCKALGQNSHAEGNDSIARGESSHVEGRSCSAVGNFAHSEGDHNTATGNGSHSEGYDNEASGNQSHAEGKGNQASGDKSHAEGEGNVVSGYAGHAEGAGNNVIGGNAHAEGGGNQASGNCSHAEGSNTTAKGASSHTEGYFTTAEGVSSHSEGYSTIANGDCSHAEGHGTKATGESSHAEGLYTKATHPNSHAEGDTTEAAGTCQHVQGKYNVVDTEGKYAHIVGNGTSSSNRSNAHTVDWDGNAWFAGKASQEAEPTEDKDLATVKWVRDLLEATTGVLESMIGEGIA